MTAEQTRKAVVGTIESLDFDHADYTLVTFRVPTDSRWVAGEYTILAALSGDGMGWRPIETAPKDGTKVLIAEPVNEEHAMDQYAVYAAWWDADEAIWTDYAVKSFGYEEVQAYAPTHWRPLPASPSLTNDKEG